MKTALAIRHLPYEDLGAFGPALAQRGFALRYAEAGQPLLDERQESLVIVLGGPIGANDVETYPFLAAELALIERRLKRGAPTMGVCLGAQMIAKVIGAKVYPAKAKEIGFAPIRLTAEGRDSCLASFAADPLALHWHGDTFDLPRGSQLLASTDICENQAFAFGPNVVGFQFHPEANPAGFERWLIGSSAELSAAGIDPRTLRADMVRHGAAIAAKGADVLHRWIDQADL
ncbi:MAG: glutamine amidotransferase [Hyphomonadaceae bacterium]|nr:MAG: GMP synthase (glutamine-hydrolysing) [Caulobacteraceae bacterium]MBT9446047.1 glutamine amidotransferase [Hyphomonadaceae bacterium]TPW07629.1 MAG: GMP synthase (glutamine-hydrolysing) [Alphaproteobacteria bacterium]